MKHSCRVEKHGRAHTAVAMLPVERIQEDSRSYNLIYENFVQQRNYQVSRIQSYLYILNYYLLLVSNKVSIR